MKIFPVRNQYIRPMKSKNGTLKSELSDKNAMATMRMFAQDGLYNIFALGVNQLWHVTSEYGKSSKSNGRRKCIWIDPSVEGFSDLIRSSRYIDLQNINKDHVNKQYIDNDDVGIVPSGNVSECESYASDLNVIPEEVIQTGEIEIGKSAPVIHIPTLQDDGEFHVELVHKQPAEKNNIELDECQKKEERE